ncbi:hypothetical protein FDT66_08725 [Polaribacter aestuariivivens]|uniref:Lipoprotein n=1 Tax=Polaribacter aestuariivivens TaxID=2304626 RepID=A0A5S3N4Y1_9FLAO|nr:hypothetical protein [Polaribacter aestuariivivens]TMM29942.1 hypothetical protein FDT66_08725 [Polaribacter aestuariivivens]
MKKTLVIIIFGLLFFSSCSKKNIPQNNSKLDSKLENRIITQEEANTFHQHFKITTPKNWNTYSDKHGFIAYSPLGSYNHRNLNFYKIDNSESQKRKIIKNNNTSKKKLGNYWNNYFDIHSVLKKQNESISDVIDNYVLMQKKRYEKNFSYKLVKENHKKLGKIFYFKYETTSNFFNTMHLDVFLFTEDRVIKLRYQTDKFYFDYYVDDVIKAVNSIEI